MPYVKGFTFGFLKIFNKYSERMKVCPVPKNQLKLSLFNNMKDRVPLLHNIFSSFTFRCSECYLSFYMHTGRSNLELSIKNMNGNYNFLKHVTSMHSVEMFPIINLMRNIRIIRKHENYLDMIRKFDVIVKDIDALRINSSYCLINASLKDLFL